MDREFLVRLLGGEDEAFAACRQSVVAGAWFWVSDHASRASELVWVYQIRARHTQQVGIPTLGFPAAVHALHTYGEQPVRLCAVDVADPPYLFMLFLEEKLTSVVACLGVDQDPAHRHRPKN